MNSSARVLKRGYRAYQAEKAIWKELVLPYRGPRPAPELPPHLKAALWAGAVRILLENSNQPPDVFLPVSSPSTVSSRQTVRR